MTNRYLADLYSTEELTKEGSFPLAAKIALMILGMRAMEGAHHDASEEQTQEANQEREREAERMAPVHESLKHGSVEDLSRSVGRSMAKQAFGIPVMGMIGGAAKSVGKVLMKPKVMMPLAIAGGTYGAYKGMSAMRNYRAGEQAPMQQGTGLPMRTGVSEYGY